MCKSSGFIPYKQIINVKKNSADKDRVSICFFVCNQNTFTKRSISMETPTEKVRPVLIAELQ